MFQNWQKKEEKKEIKKERNRSIWYLYNKKNIKKYIYDYSSLNIEFNQKSFWSIANVKC